MILAITIPSVILILIITVHYGISEKKEKKIHDYLIRHIESERFDPATYHNLERRITRKGRKLCS